MDRRRFPRIRQSFTGKGYVSGRTFDVCVVDLSSCGARVRCEEKLEIDQEISLVVFGAKAFWQVARVVNGGQGCYGLLFLCPPISLQDHLPPSQEFDAFLADHPDYQRHMPWAFAFTYPLYLVAKRYFNLDVRGMEHIPYGSRFLWTHNHSGWVSLDAPLIGYLIARENKVDRYSWTRESMGLGAMLKVLSRAEHGEWGVTFWNKAVMNFPVIAQTIKAMHGLPASVLKHPDELRKYRIFATPAEGEEGNCKSSLTELYKLKKFHSGPARLAMETDLDFILPVVIIGPEESFPCLGPFRGLQRLTRTIIPVPLLVPPIPVQWIVRFLPPIDLSLYRERHASCAGRDSRHALYREIIAVVRDRIEDALKEELRDRVPFQPWFTKR